MATAAPAGVNGAWSLYRQCAATSAFHKSQLETFTKISLWLGITGAVIGTVAQRMAPDSTSYTSKVLGVIGSVVVALAGLAATQASSGSRDKIWVKCRAAAEALKSSVYLYCASVTPFDDPNRSATLTQRAESILKELAGIELRPGKMDRQAPGQMTVADYIRDRVDDQIAYYSGSAGRLQKKADFWRYVSWTAAVVSAVFGAVSAIHSLSLWVALLATVTTSVTAYVKNQRYASMIGLYQTTAIRLQLLKDQWLDSGKTDSDKADRDSFIRRCEETLAVENGAWLAQWSQQLPQQQRQSPQGTPETPQKGSPDSRQKGDAAKST
jgi:uncharacterized membrane protein YeaQ/YmgE (transglycosylase-associated protein family)